MHSLISFGKTKRKIPFCVSVLLATRRITMPNVFNMQTMYYSNGIRRCLCFILDTELAPSDLHSEKCMSWLQVQEEQKKTCDGIRIDWNVECKTTTEMEFHAMQMLVTKKLLEISNPASTFIVNYSCCMWIIQSVLHHTLYWQSTLRYSILMCNIINSDQTDDSACAFYWRGMTLQCFVIPFGREMQSRTIKLLLHKCD